MNHEVRPLSAGLYFVATPIGSARDITLRALDVLASADVIVAEDTRTARKLMDIHGIAVGGRQMIAYHDHSTDAGAQGIVKLATEGKSVAYVSEAGTPLVADPGYELGVAAHAAGVPVTTAPGPSAVAAALTVAGLPTDRFAFVGFLPASQAARQAAIADLRQTEMTLVFYESPKRINGLLTDLCDGLGEGRDAAVCRELTKRFEETTKGTLGELKAAFRDRTVKGEIVVLVGTEGRAAIDDGAIDAALNKALETMRMKDAAITVAGAFGLPRKDIYQRALALKDTK